jgi:hypothetical protein
MRVTGLLIVMALAGTPVSVLACELWCADLQSADHHRAAMCHDGETSHDGEASHDRWQASSVDGCHNDLAILPFLPEDRRMDHRSSQQAPGTLESTVPTLLACSSARTRWNVFRVQPPGAPVPHTVLRI